MRFKNVFIATYEFDYFSKFSDGFFVGGISIAWCSIRFLFPLKNIRNIFIIIIYSDKAAADLS